MIIALDAMGGDRAPAEPVAGALLAHRELDLQVALVGEPAMLRDELAHHGPVPSGIDVVAASEAIGMDEAPVQAVRQKKQASINVAMDMARRGVASAVVSAGNTGAVMASALLNLGRVPGIERPAIGTIAPYTRTGMLVLDVGANADCKPSYLVQFAQMGAVYMEKVYGMTRPRVGLLNIGEEASKGNELTQEVYERLNQTDLNFIGNVEPDNIPNGPAEVIVTDGFTGNIAVKSVEGALEYTFRQLKAAIMSRPQYRLAALLLRPALMGLNRQLDYGEYGSAPLLGVNGVVTVAHGRADAQAMKSALRTAHAVAASGMLDGLRAAFGASARGREPVESSATPRSDGPRA